MVNDPCSYFVVGSEFVITQRVDHGELMVLQMLIDYVNKPLDNRRDDNQQSLSMIWVRVNPEYHKKNMGERHNKTTDIFYTFCGARQS